MKAFISENRRFILGFFISFLVFLAAFYLYHLPLEAVIYPFLICFFVNLFLFFKSYISYRKKTNDLRRLSENSCILPEELEIYNQETDKYYKRIIQNQNEMINNLQQGKQQDIKDMNDYYTMWVHQIKTPISSVSLMLQNEDTELSRQISEQILNIQSYVDMALVYAKLEEKDDDFVFKRWDLDLIVKEAVKKYSIIFIKKRIALDYKSIKKSVLTDKKWLEFVICQIISNSLKYTNSGSINIRFEKDSLIIQDTGSGIKKEDIKRIFEKGYTGLNGRIGENSSGIGLYISKRIIDKLGHEIIAVSEENRGTKMMIRFFEDEKIYE